MTLRPSVFQFQTIKQRMWMSPRTTYPNAADPVFFQLLWRIIGWPRTSKSKKKFFQWISHSVAGSHRR